MFGNTCQARPASAICSGVIVGPSTPRAASPGGVDQGLGRSGLVDRRIELVLQFIGGDAGVVAPARAGDGAALLHHQTGITLVEPADAVQAVGGAIGVVVAVFE